MDSNSNTITTTTPAVGATTTAVATTIAGIKCNVVGCRANNQMQLYLCANEGCTRNVHVLCYQGKILLDKKNGTNLDPLPDGQVTCTKACYKAVVKAKSVDSRGTWNTDGLKGSDDPHTSMKILLDWMTEQGNYSKYRGKDNEGVKKKQFATVLAEKMKEETSSKSRTPKQVLAKIKHIEEQFRIAHNFATSETGAGLEEANGETFQDMVRKKCQYYYELLEIMGDRAGTEPRITNADPSVLDSFSDVDDPVTEEGVEDIISVNEDGSVIQNISQVIAKAGSSQETGKASGKSVATRSGQKKKKTKRSNTPLMDDETVANA